MGSLYVTGEQDAGSRAANLHKDLVAVDKFLGNISLDPFTTAAYADAGTTVLSSAYTYLTAGGTIAAHTFNLPAAPADGEEHQMMTSQVTTAATFGVVSPGDATIVGAPSATAIHTVIKFKYYAEQNKWYKHH